MKSFAPATPETTCRICAGPLTPFIRDLYDDRFGHPGEYSVSRCANCGFGMIDQPLSESRLGGLYTEYYPRRDVTVEQVRQAASYQGTFRDKLLGYWKGTNVSCHRQVHTGERVLDMGCGAGVSLIEIAQMGAKPFGTEYDLNVKTIAEKLGLEISFSGHLSEAFPGMKFDCITASQVLEHVPDAEKKLGEIRARLSDQGRFIFSVPNFGSLNRILSGSHWINWHVPYHLYFFTRKSLKILAEKSGYRLEKMKTVTPTEWLKLQLMEIFFHAKPGETSPTWNPTHKHPRGFLIARKTISAVALILTPLLRFIDVLGWGDSFLVELRPYAPAVKTGT
jgi:2-polyprenyl-3-methyl-5-hydroxy-6-metoxy-1,4-benzoquinol methylase